MSRGPGGAARSTKPRPRTDSTRSSCTPSSSSFLRRRATYTHTLCAASFGPRGNAAVSCERDTTRPAASTRHCISALCTTVSSTRRPRPLRLPPCVSSAQPAHCDGGKAGSSADEGAAIKPCAAGRINAIRCARKRRGASGRTRKASAPSSSARISSTSSACGATTTIGQRSRGRSCARLVAPWPSTSTLSSTTASKRASRAASSACCTPGSHRQRMPSRASVWLSAASMRRPGPTNSTRRAG